MENITNKKSSRSKIAKKKDSKCNHADAKDTKEQKWDDLDKKIKRLLYVSEKTILKVVAIDRCHLYSQKNPYEYGKRDHRLEKLDKNVMLLQRRIKRLHAAFTKCQRGFPNLPYKFDDVNDKLNVLENDFIKLKTQLKEVQVKIFGEIRVEIDDDDEAYMKKFKYRGCKCISNGQVSNDKHNCIDNIYGDDIYAEPEQLIDIFKDDENNEKSKKEKGKKNDDDEYEDISDDDDDDMKEEIDAIEKLFMSFVVHVLTHK